MPFNVRNFWFWWQKCPVCHKWLPDIEEILINHYELMHMIFTTFQKPMPKWKYFNITLDDYIIMPTAQEQGLIESKFGTPFVVGDKVELSEMPTFGHSDKLDCDTVAIKTTDGLRSTTSKSIIGQLRSDNPKSVVGLLTQALNAKSTLTVWVVEKEANTGKGFKNLSLSIFSPKS